MCMLDCVQLFLYCSVQSLAVHHWSGPALTFSLVGDSLLHLLLNTSHTSSLPCLQCGPTLLCKKTPHLNYQYTNINHCESSIKTRISLINPISKYSIRKDIFFFKQNDGLETESRCMLSFETKSGFVKSRRPHYRWFVNF